MTMVQGPDPAALDRVAFAALSRVADGMTLGLGTGRAAEAFIQRLGEKVRRGMRIRGVPTSKRSEELAQRLQIECVSLDAIDGIDIAFDGADEVAPDLALTKGLGGALLRERVVAYEAEKLVILVTPEKIVPKLGTRTAIPIEVVPFAVATASRPRDCASWKSSCRTGCPAEFAINGLSSQITTYAKSLTNANSFVFEKKTPFSIPIEMSQSPTSNASQARLIAP
jgi:ribose 5-phosphate isomerase A